VKPIKLTYVDALRLLEKAVADKGSGYVYERIPLADSQVCQYFHAGQPSCIVGHVLAYEGVTQADLSDGLNRAGVGALGIEVDTETMLLLKLAQRFQDAGVAWGETVLRARRTAGREEVTL
jgi:hypothetical protein